MTVPAGAFAAGTAVSIPAGPFANGQQIVVSGTGFPPHSQLPAGLQIIECSDPGGTKANLPTDAVSGCEGITVNPSQVNTDASGAFRTSYQIIALSSSAGTSSIDCSSTQLCVLWVGADYNNQFTSGPHAFSEPFAVAGASGATTTTTPTTATPTTGVSSATTVAPAAVSAQSATSAQGSLAATGAPGLVRWLVGVGGLLALLGLVGRRLSARRASPSSR